MMLLSKPRIFFLIIAAQFLSIASTCWAQQAAGSTKPSEKPNGVITGRVVNSAGEPLSGAVVYAALLGTSSRSQRATVDTNGEFKIDDLQAGLYRISAGAPGYVPAWQPGPPDSQAYYHIGDSVTLRLMKGGVITGTVTGPKGPLVAVGVYAIRVRDEADKPLTPSMVFHERATDDRGVYRFYGLLPGGYLISAAKPRIGLVAPTAYDNDTPTYFPSSTRDTAAEVAVREGEEIMADIQYRAEPGHAISGKVWVSSNPKPNCRRAPRSTLPPYVTDPPLWARQQARMTTSALPSMASPMANMNCPLFSSCKAAMSSDRRHNESLCVAPT